MNKILPWLLAALSLILGGVAWWQYSEAEQARRERELTLGTLNTVQTDLDATRRALADERSKQAAAPASAPAPAPAADEEEPAKTADAETPPNPPEGGRFRPNAAMRKFFEQQMRSRLKQEYQTLFTKLGLKPEDQEKLLNLLMKRRQAQGRRGFFDDLGLDSSGNPRTAAVDQEIKTLLGDDNYSQYQDYQQNLPGVRQINQLREQLVGTSAPLQDYQVQQLQDIMKLERNQGGANNTPPADLTPEQRLAAVQDYQNRVLQRAQGILQPQQLQALQAEQQTRISFLQAAAESSRSGTTPPRP